MFISSHVGLNETFKQLRAVVLAYGDLIVNYFSIQLFGDFRIILEHFSTHLSHDTWDSHTHTHTHTATATHDYLPYRQLALFLPFHKMHNLKMICSCSFYSVWDLEAVQLIKTTLNYEALRHGGSCL